MSEVTRWYPSKIDWWLGAILVAAPLSALAPIVGGGPLPAVLVTPLVLLAVYAGVVFPMRYGISGDKLTIRFGLIRRSVPLARITHVRPTRNPLSSPALSLDRLEIRFGSGLFERVLISPADRWGFLTDLAARANLRRDGDRLWR